MTNGTSGSAGRATRARLAILAPAVALAVLVAGAVTGAPSKAETAVSERGQARAAATPAARVNRFPMSTAWSWARYQVALGPRPAGSPASAQLAARLRAALPRGRFEPVPGGLRNVVGHFPGRRPAIVIAAHYDTKDTPGFVGANDGAAGTAVVVGLARALRRHRPRGGREIRLVAFDGEESPRGAPNTVAGFLQFGLRGSRAYVRAHRREVSRLILVDLVGDRSLSIPREAGSHRGLWSALRRAATRVGVGRVFPGRAGPRVYDDHYPFARAGIPAIDVNDFSYPHFHTNADTLDKISPRSLDAVGEAVVELVRTIGAPPPPPPRPRAR